MTRRKLPQAPAYWYDGSPPPLSARALSALYGGVTALRRTAYRRGWMGRRQAGAPVIVVGNITAGGTGKTPLVIALVARLRAQGWTPGVACRGHGREDEATGFEKAERAAVIRALARAEGDDVVAVEAHAELDGGRHAGFIAERSERDELSARGLVRQA